MLGDGRLIKRRIRDGKGWVSIFFFSPLELVLVRKHRLKDAT